MMYTHIRLSRWAIAAVGSACWLGCSQEVPFAEVEQEAQPLAFYSGRDDEDRPESPLNKITDDVVDLCWVPDNNIGTTSPQDYAARQATLQEVINRWQRGTRLQFVWRTCRPPQLDGDGKLSYAQDERRIYLDAEPHRPDGENLPGADCGGHKFLGKAFGHYGLYRCALNNVLLFEEDDGMALHEIGHSFGFAHEHDRIDATEDCWDIVRQIQAVPSPPLAIPDGDTQVGLEYNRSVAPESNSVTRIMMRIDVPHTRPDDLVIELRSPTNRLAVLHDRATSPTRRIWDSSVDTVLQVFRGDVVGGVWKLRIRDMAGGGTGVLGLYWVSINQHPPASAPLDLTSFDSFSVMQYAGPPGCPTRPDYHAGSLSNQDILGAEIAYGYLAQMPVFGEGIHRTDMPIQLESSWLVRGASAARFTEPRWLVSNSTTIVHDVTTPSATVAPLNAGEYSTLFRMVDPWLRLRSHWGSFTVMTPSDHTALVSAAVL